MGRSRGRVICPTLISNSYDMFCSTISPLQQEKLIKKYYAETDLCGFVSTIHGEFMS